MRGQSASDWRSIAPPIVFDDESIEALAETIWDIHKNVVSSAGFDLTEVISEQQRKNRIGKIQSVLNPVFATIFGESPIDRYSDIFDQVSDFADHLANRHIFADGNKRTTVIMSMAILAVKSAMIDVADSPSPNQNEIYRWIQDIVTGDRSKSELAVFLRQHAKYMPYEQHPQSNGEIGE